MVSERRIISIPILAPFHPGDFVSPLKAENRVMAHAFIARGKVAWRLAAGVVYEVHLYSVRLIS